jgi:hypothetical protein
MANLLPSRLGLVNFAHGSLKYLLQSFCGGRVRTVKFVDHGERARFFGGVLTLRNLKIASVLAQYSVAPGGAQDVSLVSAAGCRKRAGEKNLS